MTRATITDEVLAWAAAALALKGCDRQALLDGQDAPTYVTDEEGFLLYANEACERFAGRKPEPGEDRFAVAWKLYTDDGEFLYKDQSPLALAIRQRRPIHGATGVAERPDGTRVPFRAYPTPIFGRDGKLVGAANVVIPA
jgi:PAS domain S-box-containing protein